MDKVKRAGYEVVTEERMEAPQFHVSGRADLLIKGADKTILYEIKTMHSRGFWYREKGGRLALRQPLSHSPTSPLLNSLIG